MPTPILAAPAITPAGARLHIGGRVQWCGAAWIVTALHSHPRFGRFARLEDGAGRYDLVHLNGNDGALEQLGPTA